jgi:NADPH2:quinone reductase
VSSKEKAEVARESGCEYPIVHTEEDVVARVKALSGGRGVPVVYDSVGASTFEMTLACLKPRGIAVSFGSASGPVPPLELWRLNRLGSLYVTSAGLADYIDDRGELLERASELFEVLQHGAVRIAINQRYKLDDAAQAHRDLEARRTTGSSVIQVD